MSGALAPEGGDNYLLLVVGLYGRPPPGPRLLADQATDEGRLTLRHRPDAAIECRIDHARSDGREASLVVVSCPLVLDQDGPFLCVAEVKWRMPALLELCLDGTLVASTDDSRPIPALHRLNGGEPPDGKR